jgi:hypothetical protein
VLLEAVATPAVNQVTSLAIVLLQALRHPCVVVGVVGMEEASEVDTLAPIVPQLATNVVDLIIMLATAKPRQ